MSSWQNYLFTLRSKTNSFGQDMTDTDRQKLSKDQQVKMAEMKNEAARLKEP
jgi:hypothetical protein